MNSGIYQIMNRLNYHMYIGGTGNFTERWKNHRQCLRKGNHSNSHLQRAWDKYGENAFEFSIVELTICDKNTIAIREQYYTDLWNPEYAIRKECVTSCLGIKRSEEFKNNLRKPRPAEVCEKIRLAVTGVPKSEEHRRKMSIINSDGRHAGQNNAFFGDHRFAGENHPMFGRRGSLSPHFGKKKPEHSIKMSGQNNPMSKTNRALREISK